MCGKATQANENLYGMSIIYILSVAAVRPVCIKLNNIFLVLPYWRKRVRYYVYKNIIMNLGTRYYMGKIDNEIYVDGF